MHQNASAVSLRLWLQDTSDGRPILSGTGMHIAMTDIISVDDLCRIARKGGSTMCHRLQLRLGLALSRLARLSLALLGIVLALSISSWSYEERSDVQQPLSCR